MAPKPNQEKHSNGGYLKWAGFIITIVVLLSTSVYNVAISHAKIDRNVADIQVNNNRTKENHEKISAVELKLSEMSGDIRVIRTILEAHAVEAITAAKKNTP